MNVLAHNINQVRKEIKARFDKLKAAQDALDLDVETNQFKIRDYEIKLRELEWVIDWLNTAVVMSAQNDKLNLYS